MALQFRSSPDVSHPDVYAIHRREPAGGRPAPASAPWSADEFYAFADFRLYPGRRALYRRSARVPLGGRAFDLLLALVSEAGTIVSAETLIRSVWGDINVEKANLRVQMRHLREMLSSGDDENRAIETVALRGYCFTLSVSRHPADGDGVVALPTRQAFERRGQPAEICQCARLQLVATGMALRIGSGDCSGHLSPLVCLAQGLRAGSGGIVLVLVEPAPF